MTHLEMENLASDYLEGLLEPSQHEAVDAHLSDCAACRELLGDVRQALELCRRTEVAEPRPWLISRIMRATVGEQRLTWRQRLAAYLGLIHHPRVVYSLAMTVFTFSIMVNAAGLNLRSLRLQDLDPRTWLDRADRQGHLMYAHAEKFYYDLRVVYEIESRFRQFSDNPPMQREESPKEPPAGGSSEGAPADQAVAANRGAGFADSPGKQAVLTRGM